MDYLCRPHSLCWHSAAPGNGRMDNCSVDVAGSLGCTSALGTCRKEGVIQETLPCFSEAAHEALVKADWSMCAPTGLALAYLHGHGYNQTKGIRALLSTGCMGVQASAEELFGELVHF